MRSAPHSGAARSADIQRTQAIAQAVEAHPDLDYTKAASMVLMDGLMQRVSTAEDDFQEMPLDKAGRLIASLARNATYEKARPAGHEEKKLSLPSSRGDGAHGSNQAAP